LNVLGWLLLMMMLRAPPQQRQHDSNRYAKLLAPKFTSSMSSAATFTESQLSNLQQLQFTSGFFRAFRGHRGSNLPSADFADKRRLKTKTLSPRADTPSSNKRASDLHIDVSVCTFLHLRQSASSADSNLPHC
jgi:hypothetical protein